MAIFKSKFVLFALSVSLSFLLFGCGGGSSAGTANGGAGTNGTGATGGSGSYFLLASAGSQSPSGTGNFSNSVQGVPMPLLMGVNTAAPLSGSVTTEAAGQTPTFLPIASVLEGTVNSGQITNLHSRFGVYFKGVQLYKVDQAVASGGVPTPQLISTLLSTAVCANGGTPSLDPFANGNDYANAANSWIFFHAPGTDSTCSTSDDVFRAVRMDIDRKSTRLNSSH